MIKFDQKYLLILESKHGERNNTDRKCPGSNWAI